MNPNARTVVSEMLRELESKIGATGFRLSEDGVCAFSCDNLPRVVLECPDEGPLLYLYAAVSPDLPKDRVREVLAAGFLGRETAGAAFALNPASGELTLWRALPAASRTPEEVMEAVSLFVETAGEWRARFTAGAGAGARNTGSALPFMPDLA